MFLPVNYRTRGLLTATKTRLPETKDLGTISVDWVLSANYYDKYNQLIQILTDNHFGSLDIISNKINFTGQLLTTKTNHRSHTTYAIVETQSFEYDHSGRLINTFHQLGSTKPVHLSNQVYYDYGSLKDKKLHEVSGKWTQSILYKYNIRGWLTDINDIDKQGDDYYCMKLKYDDADNPQYNGNIGQVFYKYTIGEGNHLFSYDELNRLTAAEYSGNGDFSASYSYDLNGNIQSLNRDGLIGESIWGAIDELSYTYTGNQLMAVDDNTAAQYQNNGYSDHGSFEPQEFAYDNNGNMTNDLNKRTMNLEYNYLNLPNKIQILNQDGLNSIYYIYDAAGNKLRKQTETEGTIVKTTDYLGNFVYEDNKLSFILTAEGRITPKEGGGYDYQYFIKDHLGNTRALFNADSLQQVNMYYPFGMLADGMRLNQSLSNDNRYLYNGKELQDDFGLDWYDYGARFYDAQLGRFHTQDRFSEKYYSLTNYGYAANNPVLMIDVNGDSLWINHKGNDILYENGNLSNADGTAYTGKGVKVKKDESIKLKGFLKQTVNALGSVGGTQEGSSLISELQGSNNNFTIEKSSSNSFSPDNTSASFANIPELQDVSGNSLGSSGSGGTIYFNPNSTQSGFNTAGNRNRPSYVGLAHEMFHGRDANQGLLYYDHNYTNAFSGRTYNAQHNGVNKSEWRAVYYENLLRSQAGLPLRTHYRVQQTSNGYQPTGTRLIDANNNPINYIVK